MPAVEYLVVPAPSRPIRMSGLLAREADFADSIALMLNDLGQDGWEYVRTDSLTIRGLFGLKRSVDLMIWVRREEAPKAKKVPPVRPAIPEHLVSPRRYGADAKSRTSTDAA